MVCVAWHAWTAARKRPCSGDRRTDPLRPAAAPSLLPRQQKQKKRPSVALTDLASLTSSLAEAAAGLQGGGARREFGRSVGTQRAREKVAEVEAPRLQAVWAHPQFRANPLAAVASHLAATLPPPPPKPAAGGPAKDAATLRREKKKRRKERARAEGAMED